MQYFADTRAPADYHTAETTELGHLVYLQLRPHRRTEEALMDAVLKALERVHVLRVAHARYPWFDEILFHIMRNRVRPATATATPLKDFTAVDASKAARSFPNVLVGSATSAAAVDEWIMTYPGLEELESEYVRERVNTEKILPVTTAPFLLYPFPRPRG
jgi:hypothetical protein